MSLSTRQKELFAGESWTVLYRAFTQINFNASDPPSINAALRQYIETNYPEDFNDWIEQSEFVAIIDLLSWLAGNLAFKTDLAVRENFLEVAEARESILRLARFLSYNATRCRPATGIVKITSVSTDDDVFDSFGTNLSNVPVIWNNTDDANWQERFIAILNNAFIANNPYGIPLKQGTVQSVEAQLYRLNGLVIENQLGFNSTVGGTGMDFELCNGDFDDGGVLFERPPNPNSAFHIYNLNDGNGNGSTRTGFFMLFKQGTFGYQDSRISQPIANQIIDVGTGNVNENDVWVQTVSDNGNVLVDWIKVPIVLDSNITYNSLPINQRDIFSVITRDSDQVSIRFSDGLYGSAPSGNIRISYRVSNGLSYAIKPLDIDSKQMAFTYKNANGVNKTLVITYSLQESVTNAATAETVEEIRSRAPQVYATQNRMVNGEDYNTFPLQTNLARRIKAVNRVYSGHSRYIDLHDPTGTYQDLSVFEEDGIFFKEKSNSYNEVPTSLTYTARDIVSLFVQPVAASIEMTNAVRDLYIQNMNIGINIQQDLIWNQSRSVLYNKTGWFTASSGISTATSNVIVSGCQLQFLLPDGVTKKWISIVDVSLSIGTAPVGATNGPVTFTDVIPSNSRVIAIVPRFLTAITPTTLVSCIDSITKKLSFSLDYDYGVAGGTWSLAAPVANLGVIGLSGSKVKLITVDYLPGNGNLTGLWRISGHGLRYVFESLHNVEWFDNSFRAIDQSTGQSSSDLISVLKINEDKNNTAGRALKRNYDLSITNIYSYDDGVIEPRRTNVKLKDSYGYGYPDDPDTFYNVIDHTNSYNQYLFWYVQSTGSYVTPYDFNNTTNSGLLIAYDTDVLMNADTTRAIGTEAFIVSSSTSALLNNTFWVYSSNIVGNTTVNSWVLDTSKTWQYKIGRGPNTVGVWVTAHGNATPSGDELAFHWKHYAPTDHRIDPSITNLHDIFVLTYSYDTAIRQWIKNGSNPADIPSAPTELDLRLAFADMENFRMFSDGIIWRPVRYKLLFGNSADTSLQANFKVVRLPDATLSDGEIKSRIISAMNTYFDVTFWDFGDTFYFTALAAYIHQQLPGIVASIVIVPLNASGSFGNDFEIECAPDEIMVSTATVANIQIITSNTPANLRIR